MMGLGARRRAWAMGFAVLIGLIVPHPTSAQATQQTAQARTLFEEGVALADRGDWVGAADRFERAYSLKPTPGIAFNWASALAETGNLLHAQELLLKIERDASVDSSLKKQCEQTRRSIEPRIAKLRVRVEGQTSADARVEVDGEPWARAAWDVTSPIDPGLHTVVLVAEGLEQARAQLTLPEGGSREVVLSTRGEHVALPIASATNDAKTRSVVFATPTQHHRDEPRNLRRKRWVLWASVGAAVVAGGVVAGVMLAKRKEPGTEAPIGGDGPGVIRW
ncbi:MAG: hypothetical protein ABW252_18920 [Polyangiales bacterium]